jgi:hypothetical protein
MALVVGGLGWERRAHAQPSAAEVVWEYATVEDLEQYNYGNIRINTANICFHTVNGCRWETIRVNTTRWSGTNDAVAAATARLGQEGWEVVTASHATELKRESFLLKRLRPRSTEP